MPGSRQVSINGQLRPAEADASLLDVLRNELGLTATRFGCGGPQACGACMVLVDGTPAYACTLPIDAIGNKTVTMRRENNRVEINPLQIGRRRMR